MGERRALVIHGHFYQPPRENPYTGLIPRERGAAPYHDYNERIHAECYRANAYARIVDDSDRIVDIVNNYAQMSFNFGPTLLRWIESHDHRSYRRILEADRSSLMRCGHGNALAQAHSHAILPLCNDRDLRTEIRWGLREFTYRFGREAEAMWLPETACDDRVLNALAAEGLRFAVLAPRQAGAVEHEDKWIELDETKVDTRRPYRWRSSDGAGRELAIFFYHGALSRAVAFEDVLSSSGSLLDRCEDAVGEGGLVQLVTDGESYGHHFPHGERCLAHALAVEAERRGFSVTNYATYLEQHEPEQTVRLAQGYQGEGTSWSCEHGVSRWYRDCGCSTGGAEGHEQAWRGPLRAALDYLRDQSVRVFEEQAGAIVKTPWALRDAYVDVVVNPSLDKEAWLEAHCAGQLREHQREVEPNVAPLSDRTRERLWKLLESQHSALSMYTSCGWFFSDIGGIEAGIVMRHAGRLIDQLRSLSGDGCERHFLQILAEARSNDRARGNGADIFAELVPRARSRSEGDGARSRGAAGVAHGEQSLEEDPFVRQLATLRRDLFDGQAVRTLVAKMTAADEEQREASVSTLTADRASALAHHLTEVLGAEVRRVCAGHEDLTRATVAEPMARVQSLLSLAKELDITVDVAAAQEHLFERLRTEITAGATLGFPDEATRELSDVLGLRLLPS